MLSDQADILHLRDAVLACNHRGRWHATADIICIRCSTARSRPIAILGHAHFRKLLDELGLLNNVVTMCAAAMPGTIILVH